MINDPLTRGERIRLEALSQARCILGMVVIPDTKAGEPLTIYNLFATAQLIEQFLKAAKEGVN